MIRRMTDDVQECGGDEVGKKMDAWMRMVLVMLRKRKIMINITKKRKRKVAVFLVTTLMKRWKMMMDHGDTISKKKNRFTLCLTSTLTLEYDLDMLLVYFSFA